ncbi:MAG: cytochrome c biogenesis CcdA family protein [Candidatus Limnocylindrales bacterium]
MPDLSLATAFVAGLISFLSPCVLPVVPAYLGQLGAIAVLAPVGLPATGAIDEEGRRWRAFRAALAFVLGFGVVFTLLGLTVYVGGSLGVSLPFLRQIGGIVLIVLGLNMIGLLSIPALARSWRPLERVGAGGFGSATPKGPHAATSTLGAFGLGTVFAVGWTPCIGPTLGAILGLAALGASTQTVALFAFFALGLAIPFLALALTLDRAPMLIRLLRRHARALEVGGGILVIVIGVAVLFDWLFVLASSLSWLWPQV